MARYLIMAVVGGLAMSAIVALLGSVAFLFAQRIHRLRAQSSGANTSQFTVQLDIVPDRIVLMHSGRAPIVLFSDFGGGTQHALTTNKHDQTSIEREAA
jgi:hypothetical protein